MTRAQVFHQQREQSHGHNGGAETGAGRGLHRHAGAGVDTWHLLHQPLSLSLSLSLSYLHALLSAGCCNGVFVHDSNNIKRVCVALCVCV